MHTYAHHEHLTNAERMARQARLEATAKQLALADGWLDVDQLVVSPNYVFQVGPRGLRLFEPQFVQPVWHHYLLQADRFLSMEDINAAAANQTVQ